MKPRKRPLTITGIFIMAVSVVLQYVHLLLMGYTTVSSDLFLLYTWLFVAGAVISLAGVLFDR